MTSLLAEETTENGVETSRSQLRGRMSTGCEALDEVLLGGYPENYAVLLSSPACDERDLLLRRFLERDADSGITIYLTRDPRCGVDLAANNGESFYIVASEDYSRVPKGANIIAVPRCDDLCSLSIAVSSLLRRAEPGLRGPRKLVIDLISDVLMCRGAVVARTWLWEIIMRAKARGFTIVGVLNPRMHPSRDVEALVELFDGHISIEERESDGGLKRLARVRKMYACGYSDRPVELDRLDLERPLRPHPR